MQLLVTTITFGARIVIHIFTMHMSNLLILPSSGYDNEVLLCDISSDKFNSKPPHLRVKDVTASTSTTSGALEAPVAKKAKCAVEGFEMYSHDSLTHSTHSFSYEIVGAESEPVASSSKLKEQHERGFKAESRWMGIDVFADTHGNEVLHGLCDYGSIYFLENSSKMTAVK